MPSPYFPQYAHEVRTCDEILRKIRFFREAAGKLDLTVQSVDDVSDDLETSTINLVELVRACPLFLTRCACLKYDLLPHPTMTTEGRCTDMVLFTIAEQRTE
jgi:hypothetical protein